MIKKRFFQVFNSSLQSFTRIRAVGNPANNNKAYNKFDVVDGIIYLSKDVF